MLCKTKKEIEKTLAFVKDKINQEAINYGFYDTDEERMKDVEKRFQLFLDLEGPNRLFKCKEKFLNINLKKVLKTIRFQDEENVLLLAVVKNRIVDKISFNGQETHLDFSDYYKNEAFSFMKKWKEKGALILNYHNHPNSIAARPSSDDIKNLSMNSDLDDYFGNKRDSVLNVFAQNGLDNFAFDDWGVVTKFDFFSMTQKHDALIKLYEESQNKTSSILR